MQLKMCLSVLVPTEADVFVASVCASYRKTSSKMYVNDLPVGGPFREW